MLSSKTHGTAVFSVDHKYRYVLGRVWGNNRYPLFIGLNPATADAKKGDHTIRRCINFAKDWGYGGVWVVNLFAFRTPFPIILKGCPNPIGNVNDKYIKDLADTASIIIAAWGASGVYKNRNFEVCQLLKDKKLYCLGKNKDGSPKHPLYLPREVEIEIWKDYQNTNG